jgi:transcription initiation factor TFIID TATA-box-binding protein
MSRGQDFYETLRSNSHQLTAEAVAAAVATATENAPIRYTPRLTNVVCTCHLGVSVDLLRLAHLLPGKYHRKRFSSFVLRLRTPKVTCLIFTSGRMVCTGSESLEVARVAMARVTHLLRGAGFRVRMHQFAVQNMVASVYVGHAMDVAQLDRHCGCESRYRGDMFPGLVYRGSGSRDVTFLVFPSGQMVITGAKAEYQIVSAFEREKVVFERHRAISCTA